MSGPMADYRNGCLKMLEAMEEKDKYDLYEAKEWFGRVKVSTWQDVVAADTGVKEADKVPEVYFDAEFADSLLRHNFDFVPLDEIWEKSDIVSLNCPLNPDTLTGQWPHWSAGPRESVPAGFV